MRESSDVRRIGALAAASGVTVDTLRYYEREGLLPPADRTAGGFRLYTKEIAQRLRFIKQARQLGLTLREIRQLVEPDNSCCSAMREVIAARLTDVEAKLKELSAFRRTLKHALDRCEENRAHAQDEACPVAHRLEMEQQRVPATKPVPDRPLSS